jgi:hypothetical protein
MGPGARALPILGRARSRRAAPADVVHRLRATPRPTRAPSRRVTPCRDRPLPCLASPDLASCLCPLPPLSRGRPRVDAALNGCNLCGAHFAPRSWSIHEPCRWAHAEHTLSLGSEAVHFLGGAHAARDWCGRAWRSSQKRTGLAWLSSNRRQRSSGNGTARGNLCDVSSIAGALWLPPSTSLGAMRSIGAIVDDTCRPIAKPSPMRRARNTRERDSPFQARRSSMEPSGRQDRTHLMVQQKSLHFCRLWKL